VIFQTFFLKSPDETLNEKFSLCCARMRPILRNMRGSKVFFRFSNGFAAVVIEGGKRRFGAFSV
jgi:hypothetical protein